MQIYKKLLLFLLILTWGYFSIEILRQSGRKGDGQRENHRCENHGLVASCTHTKDKESSLKLR